MALISDPGAWSRDQKLRSFVGEARVGVLAVNKADGGPWLQPLWYLTDGDELAVAILRRSVAGGAVLHDRRASLCVHDDVLPYRLATFECETHIEKREPECLDVLRRLVSRYRPHIDPIVEADSYWEAGVVVLKLTVVGGTFLAPVLD